MPGPRPLAIGSQQCCAKAGRDARTFRRQSRFAWRDVVTTARSALRPRVPVPAYLHAVQWPQRQGLPAPLRVDTRWRTLAWQWPTLLLHSPLTAHRSPLTAHRSALTPHPAPSLSPSPSLSHMQASKVRCCGAHHCRAQRRESGTIQRLLMPGPGHSAGARCAALLALLAPL